MKWTRWLIGPCLGVLAHYAGAAEPPARAATPELAAAEAAVRRALPGTSIASVRPSPIPGLVEVVAGANLLYADTTGRWLVVGHLYDLETGTDVTAERIAAKAQAVRWADLPFEAAVQYGAGPLEVAVFSDPDCPWCRKLHADLRGGEGIRVHEIMYPLPALHPDAEEKAVWILCEADPPAALDRVMAGGRLPDGDSPAECVDRARAAVRRAMAFGERISVRGTPTLVAPDGRTHSGYLPPDALRTWLRDERPSGAAARR